MSVKSGVALDGERWRTPVRRGWKGKVFSVRRTRLAGDTPRRIAVIDDSITHRDHLTSILSRIGNCSIATFERFDDRLLDTLEKGFDLVVVDNMMPEMSGIELVTLLRSRPKLEKVPVIMLTSSADQDTRWAAFAAGVTQFQTKPINPHEFREKVCGLMSVPA